MYPSSKRRLCFVRAGTALACFSVTIAAGASAPAATPATPHKTKKASAVPTGKAPPASVKPGAVMPVTKKVPPAAVAAAPEEIMVGAQRRLQRAQNVGIVVNTYSGTELRERQINNSADIGRTTPGVFVSASDGGQFAAFSIRGVTQNDITDGVEPPVAVYVDDTYVPSIQGQSFGLFDLTNVEILKGPQGTLFGRNATGGLVNFNIAKPTDYLSGYINTTYGAYNQAKVETAVGGPVARHLEGRVSFLYKRNDGYMTNEYPGKPNLGGDDTVGGRLQLQSQVTDRLKIRLTGSGMRSNDSSSPYNTYASTPVSDAEGRTTNSLFSSGKTGLGYYGLPAGKFATSSDFACASCNQVRLYDAALHVDYDLGNTTISSVTDFKRMTKRFFMDADSSPSNFVNVGQAAQQNAVWQELRATGHFDKLIWNAGANFLYIDTHSQAGYLAPENSLYALGNGFTGTGIDDINQTHLKDRSFSEFAQLEYKITPKLTATVGGRIIEEHQNYHLTSDRYLSSNPYSINVTDYYSTLQNPYADARDNTLWSAKWALNYQMTKDVLFYANVSRGTKVGNFNDKYYDAASSLPASQVAYKPETLWDYEGGIKSSFLHDRIMFNLSGYYYDYKNYQAYTFANASGYVQNRNATMYGGEFMWGFRPLKGWTVTAGLSLQHATIHDLAIAPGLYRNTQPSFMPQRQFTARSDYRFPFTVGGGTLNWGVDVYSQSSFYTNVRNFSSQRLQGYNIFGSQLTWKHPSGWSFEANVANIFDKRYGITSYDLSTICGCSEIAYGMPRWWGLTIGYHL